MEPVTITIAGAVTALVIEASKEAGKVIVKGGADWTGKLVSLVRDRFKSAEVGGIFARIQEKPTEANKTLFSDVLVEELSKDQDFANAVVELLKQLRAEGNETTQKILVGTEVEESLEVGDVIQRSSGRSAGTQEVAKDLKGKSIKIGNITQEN